MRLRRRISGSFRLSRKMHNAHDCEQIEKGAMRLLHSAFFDVCSFWFIEI